MSTDLIIILVVLAAGIAVILLWQQRAFKKMQSSGETDKHLKDWVDSTKKDMSELRQEMRGGLDKNTETLQTRLEETNRTINDRLDKAASFMKSIGDEVGQMRELGKSMKDLQSFLQSPKLRGNLGEQILQDLLDQILPSENFSSQYKFRDGQIVDAIIKTDNGLISIDSKFPLENAKKLFKADSEEEKNAIQNEFAKDVRKHIKDISKKYILPAEGTVDFAVMYIPSESIYYEVVTNIPDLIDYGQEMKVFMVSPNSFYYFLQTIMLGLRGKKIETKAKQILETLSMIQQESQKFGDKLSVLNRHVTNAKNSMDTVSGEYGKLSGKIDNVKLLK